MSYQIIENNGHLMYAAILDDGVLPGLGGFNLEFTNSDHHINRLIVGAVTSDGSGLESFDSYLLHISDGDGRSIFESSDPANKWAKYFNLGARPTFRVRGSGDSTGTASVSIPHMTSNELLILRGFFVTAPRGVNHNIRRFGIRHVRSNSTINVVFGDDSPRDDSFQFTVYYSVVEHANLTGRLVNPFYEGPFSQSFDFTKNMRLEKSVTGVSLLSGFSFQFQDSDHHLRQIKIDPISVDCFDIAFTDDEADNPVSGFLEYVNVRPYIR